MVLHVRRDIEGCATGNTLQGNYFHRVFYAVKWARKRLRSGVSGQM